MTSATLPLSPDGMADARASRQIKPAAAAPPLPGGTRSKPEVEVEVSEGGVRRWLSALGEPAQLPDPELTALLTLHKRLPTSNSAIAVGEAARDLLVQAVDRLRPPPGATRPQQLPYLVLNTCFVEGVKWATAADRLGISARQLTRERSRAIRLLRDELLAISGGDGPASFRMERIPAIAGFRPRPTVTRALSERLAGQHLVHVHGPRGIGKTSVVAELAAERMRRGPVLWMRFRGGVNASLGSVLFELGDYLAAHGRRDLASKMTDATAAPDLGIASRLALRDLAGAQQLLVFDDYHLAEADPAISGFLEEAIARLQELRVITVGRHAGGGPRVGAALAVPPLTRIETQELLAQFDVQIGPVMGGSIHEWTEGLPQLVKLAASWLKTASPQEVAAGVGGLGHQAEVRDFLLDAISEVLDAADRAILDAASTFRDRFTDEALAHVADQTMGAVEDASRRLVRRHLASRGRLGDVAFFHASVREHFYARLTPQRRRELHERAALWYESDGALSEARYHRGLLAAD